MKTWSPEFDRETDIITSTPLLQINKIRSRGIKKKLTSNFNGRSNGYIFIRLSIMSE